MSGRYGTDIRMYSGHYIDNIDLIQGFKNQAKDSVNMLDWKYGSFFSFAWIPGLISRRPSSWNRVGYFCRSGRFNGGAHLYMHHTKPAAIEKGSQSIRLGLVGRTTHRFILAPPAPNTDTWIRESQAISSGTLGDSTYLFLPHA